MAVAATDEGESRVVELFQEGCLKTRMPDVPGQREVQLVLMNTAGGLTGGDELSVEVSVREGARATVTTPACERIYRSISGVASVRQRLRVGRGGRLDWLPQETIVYDGGRLSRRLDVELESEAKVTLCEAILLGRLAMGETLMSGGFSDFWTIRQSGRLLFADAVRLGEDFQAGMNGPATLQGCFAAASILHIGPASEAKLEALRALYAEQTEAVAGASLIDGVLVSRIVASDGMALRQCLIPALAVLRDGRPLPRNWLC